MTVTVKLSEPLRSQAGARSLQVPLPGDQASLAELLEELLHRCPALAGDLGQPDAVLDEHYTIFHNIRVVHFADRGRIQLQDGDELSIMLPMVGG